jgi:hypothetical protein
MKSFSETFEGQKLSYELERDKKSGKMSATNLQAVSFRILLRIEHGCTGTAKREIL